MAKLRRKFTKNFKKEIVTAILDKRLDLTQASRDKAISKPLIQRWINDYLAKHIKGGTKQILQPPSTNERRSDEDKDKLIRDLKMTVANLYLELERVGSRKKSYELRTQH